MKSFVSLIVLLPLLLLTPFASAECFAGESAISGQPELKMDVGFRSDQFDWSIAGTSAGTNPNILSELTWDDLHILQLRLHGGLDLVMESEPWFRPHLRGQFGYGRIFSGQNQDSDYNGDNQTLEFSRSNNGADQGDVLDLSFGVGQKIPLLSEQLVLIPLVGYSYHRQNLQLLDGFQTISTSGTPPPGPFSGLNSSYDSLWRGPWTGVAMEWAVTKGLTFNALTEYHWADYSAEANWNLRADLAHPLSFEQQADGQGWVSEIGLEFLLSGNWSLALSSSFQRWTTDAGYDLVYLADGTRQVTRLNRVHWNSMSIQGGLNYHF